MPADVIGKFAPVFDFRGNRVIIWSRDMAFATSAEADAAAVTVAMASYRGAGLLYRNEIWQVADVEVTPHRLRVHGDIVHLMVLSGPIHDAWPDSQPADAVEEEWGRIEEVVPSYVDLAAWARATAAPSRGPDGR